MSTPANGTVDAPSVLFEENAARQARYGFSERQRDFERISGIDDVRTGILRVRKSWRAFHHVNPRRANLVVPRLIRADCRNPVNKPYRGGRIYSGPTEQTDRRCGPRVFARSVDGAHKNGFQRRRRENNIFKADFLAWTNFKFLRPG